MIKTKNHDISAKSVLLIDEDGKKLGEYTKEEAIAKAEEQDLDLVQVGFGDVPTCKIMNYSKIVYNQKKKKKTNTSVISKTKEIRFRTVIGENDIKTKLSHVKKFLNKGFRVKITAQLGRREKHEAARNLVNEMLNRLDTNYTIHQDGSGKGKFYSMIIAKGE